MENFIFELSIVLVGSALLSFLAVILKQPIIIAYIVCGVVVGPWGLGLVKHQEFIGTISHLGITLLLFLAGLCLHPQKLIRLFRKTALATLGNCVCSFIIAASFALIFKFSLIESLIIGLALMFSSTILVVKLLPTTRLHHERMGAMCIGILIMQDLLAIAVLAFIRCLNEPQGALMSFGVLVVKVSIFLGALVLFEQFVLRKIMRSVDRIHEVLFILGLGWCFGVASVSHAMGLFYETGAFFAGVVLARHPISLFISERLKPLRDFFLVLFFFTLGAHFDFSTMRNILMPALMLAGLFIIIKPLVFRMFFIWAGEKPQFAQETGVRLGQLSEFSLLVSFMALELGHVSASAAQFIQVVTICTFIVSSYIVVFTYPTPIGTSKTLIKD